MPAEYAWVPVETKGYMYIDCLWVSGQFKGHGYSTLLLDKCVEDSKEKGKKGLVIFILNCCIFLLTEAQKSLVLRTRYMKGAGCQKDLRYIIQTSVLLWRNTCRYLKMWQRREVLLFM